MKPLKTCANGCAKPPQAPSKVLCEDCFARLAAKIKQLSAAFERVEEKG